ncbi:hypothetical protein [Bifidobacterium eulemuris]|uniref:Uncharacterized protein n=1 Tax=Bifidobacterium eulemuris TaxID=1765219 RepID=A0A261G9Z1_9BIFI|nr:hypothetical protein [Bifidobacterium eulemuris]OZG68230.1 hypothetical protein BEUL_1243 [Bifidobacterium eulemuris]QOL31713.1 hypothetical protein BE0216_03975 [Bifidobacterium eulemuris]
MSGYDAKIFTRAQLSKAISRALDDGIYEADSLADAVYDGELGTYTEVLE